MIKIPHICSRGTEANTVSLCLAAQKEWTLHFGRRTEWHMTRLVTRAGKCSQHVRLCVIGVVYIPSPSLNQLLRRWETRGWWDWGKGSFRHWRRTRGQERTEPANTIHVCIYTGTTFVHLTPKTNTCTHAHTDNRQRISHTAQQMWQGK